MRQTPTERIEQEDRKVHQEQKRSGRQEKIQRILEELRCINSFSCSKCGRKKTLIPKVKNDKGETITSRKVIANVFGEFYSKLYAEDQLGEGSARPSQLGNKNEDRKRKPYR